MSVGVGRRTSREMDAATGVGGVEAEDTQEIAPFTATGNVII